MRVGGAARTRVRRFRIFEAEKDSQKYLQQNGAFVRIGSGLNLIAKSWRGNWKKNNCPDGYCE